MSEPQEVHDLAIARLAARAERNFALSDTLRDEIATKGYEVVDVAGGYELRAKKRYATYESTRDIRPIFDFVIFWIARFHGAQYI